MALRNEAGDIISQFDMDVLFLTRLDQRFTEAAIASAQGDLITWYRILKTIYRMLYFKIRREQGEETERMEKRLEDYFDKAHANLSISNQSNNRTIYQNSISEVETILDEIDKLLCTLLNDYDIIYPEKKKFDPTGSVEKGITGGY